MVQELSYNFCTRLIPNGIRRPAVAWQPILPGAEMVESRLLVRQYGCFLYEVSFVREK